MLNVAHSLDVSIILNIVPEYIAAFRQALQKL